MQFFFCFFVIGCSAFFGRASVVFAYPVPNEFFLGDPLIGQVLPLSPNVNIDLENALSELKALIEEVEKFAYSSQFLVDLKNLSTLLLELENEASINDEEGFIGTLGLTNQAFKDLQVDTDNNYLATSIQFILEENSAAFNQLVDGDATLYDVTPEIQESLNILLNALKVVYGQNFSSKKLNQ